MNQVFEAFRSRVHIAFFSGRKLLVSSGTVTQAIIFLSMHKERKNIACVTVLHDNIILINTAPVRFTIPFNFSFDIGTSKGKRMWVALKKSC